MTPEELEEIVQKHVEGLGEHFCAVQVLVSVVDDAGTTNVYRGSGNWFARQGMAHDFITRDQAETFTSKMPKPPPDNDGESWKDS